MCVMLLLFPFGSLGIIPGKTNKVCVFIGNLDIVFFLIWYLGFTEGEGIGL